jgi:hypothetical protein
VQSSTSNSRYYGQISSGGTAEKVWRNHNYEVTFRFTSDDLRSRFLAEALRILRPDLWQLVSTNDKDPPTPRH